MNTNGDVPSVAPPVLDEIIHSPYRLRICSLLQQLGVISLT